MKVMINGGPVQDVDEVKIIWEDASVLVDGGIQPCQVHVTATDEGLTTDVIGDGQYVIQTCWAEVQDLVDRCH